MLGTVFKYYCKSIFFIEYGGVLHYMFANIKQHRNTYNKNQK